MNREKLKKEIYFSFGLQVIFAFITLVFAIWTYFASEVKYLSIGSLSIALLITSYNYYYLAHNKKMAIAYFVFAILPIIALIFGVL